MKIRVSVPADIEKNPPVVAVEGGKGPSCKQATEAFERAMGGEIVTEELLPEYNQITVSQEQRIKA